MVPVISVTVLAFSACLVCADPNWKMALRLSLTFAGSYSVSSARAAKPHAIMMATSASPNKRRMLSPSGENSVWQLSEPALRVGRTELCRFLVPGARLRGLGDDVADIPRTDDIRVIGLREHQCGLALLRISGALEQQPCDRNVTGGEEALRTLHEIRELAWVHAPYGCCCRRGSGRRRGGGRSGGRHNGDRSYGGKRCRCGRRCGGGRCRRLTTLQRVLIGRRNLFARRQHRDLLLRSAGGARSRI